MLDHSIQDTQGHHYGYAIHVLRAAERAGYEPHLVTNRSFNPSEHEKVPGRVLPIYRVTFWTGFTENFPAPFAGRSRDVMKRFLFTYKVRLRYSEIGLAWASRNEWRTHLKRKPTNFSLLLWYILGTILIFASKLFGPPSRFVNQFFKASQSVIRKAARRIRLRRQGPLQEKHVKIFAQDTRKLFRKVRPQPGDVFFVPTLSHKDLLGLARFLKNYGRYNQETWHLLFRRNLYEGRRSEYEDTDTVDEIREAFQIFKETARSLNVCFYTDTKLLTDQYNRLGAFIFETLPIPHTYPPEESVPTDGPIRATYLGDARKEKGYHLLPQLLADLNKDLIETAKIKFFIQSNFVTEDAEVEVARWALKSLPEGAVVLYEKPLSLQEYKNLLLSSGVNLLLYDPMNYYARSSGILAESLAAGIPVIVPAGTWMSGQLQASDSSINLERVQRGMRIIRSNGSSGLSWKVGSKIHSNSLQFVVGTGDDTAQGSLEPRGLHEEQPRLPEVGAPRIEALYPSGTVFNQRFNVQPEGGSAIAVRGWSFQRGSEICFDGSPLPTTYGSSQLLTARVPDEILHHAGVFEVAVRNEAVFKTQGLVVPPDATHLLITVEWRGQPYDTTVELLQLDTHHAERRTTLRIHLEPGDKRSSGVLVPLAPETHMFRLIFVEGSEDEKLPPKQVSFHFLQRLDGSTMLTDVPGLVYNHVEEVPNLLRDLVRNYSHYRKTALKHSAFWRKTHNADFLVRRLLQVKKLD